MSWGTSSTCSGSGSRRRPRRCASCAPPMTIWYGACIRETRRSSWPGNDRVTRIEGEGVSRALKTAIYNRFLPSMGGGERHSCMLAQVLAEEGHDVDLIAHEDVGKEILGDHLGLNLKKVNLRIVPDKGEEQLATLTPPYDLFVNASYMSRVKPRAKHNLY